MNSDIYFDNNATTPIDQEVVDAMVCELSLSPSNASSIHHFGQMAKARLATARYDIAKNINALPEEIIFTSGATEGINTLIRGCNLSGKIISSTIEHSCIYQTLLNLKNEGRDVLFLHPNNDGFISCEQIKSILSDDICLVVLGSANSETGIKNEIEAIAKLLDQKKITFIVDCVTTFGKEPFIFFSGISAMVFSGHKFHGPQGSGFIYKKKTLKINPLLTGGAQEFFNRAGTENLPAIIGLAKAIKLLNKSLSKYILHMKKLRDEFEKILLNNLSDIWINKQNAPRVSNVSNIGFNGIDGESLLINLDLAKIAASHGSACSSGAIEPSRVLLNMGQSYQKAKNAIRFSFSRMNTFDEVEKACEIIISLVNQLRNL
jgi:cysteine desulfurase